MAGKGQGTEAPTPKRKKEARQEGRIARSAELTGWLSLVVAGAMIPGSASSMRSVVLEQLSAVRVVEPQELPSLFGRSLLQGAVAVLPLFGMLWIAAFAGTLGQVGFMLSAKSLKPKWERVSIRKNLQRMIGARGAVELLKQVAKATIVVYLCYATVTRLGNSLAEGAGQDIRAGVGEALASIFSMVRKVATALLVLAVMDYVYQRYTLGRDLRMTKQEIRDEMRQSEGDPMIKNRIRSLQREASRRRMLSAVESATAVVVNPTQIAVAIRYRPGVDVAPVVVASGRGLMAKKIREAALTASVPVVRSIPLARALEKSCEVGGMVPPGLYDAVARLLAFLARVGRGVSWAGVLDLPYAYTVEIPDLKRRRTRR